MLSQYISDTQNLLNDAQGQFFPASTLISYINRARRRVCYASGCLRLVPAGTRTHPLQEIYPFAHWNSLVQQQMPGAQSILNCRTLAVSIGVGGWKPMWRRVVFSDFQARFRIYNGTFYGTVNEPGWYSQLGKGPAGALYLAPIPSTSNPIDVDLDLIPTPLLTDNDPEPIPMPWTDAVSYWAAVMALLQQQRAEDAKAMALLFSTDLPMCASAVCPQLITNPYGATMRSA